MQALKFQPVCTREPVSWGPCWLLRMGCLSGLAPDGDSQHPSFFHFQSEVKHQVLKVFTWEVGTVQPMHCRCIFAYYNLSFLLERLIKFIKDTTELLHYGKARIESINLRFVPNKMERGNDRSDALWQTLIWF